MDAVVDRMATVAKKPERTIPVRLTDEAIRWARIASGYTGESMAQYVSRITVERGKQDADEWHEKLSGGQPPSGPGSRPATPPKRKERK
jgi:hypothetical protein